MAAGCAADAAGAAIIAPATMAGRANTASLVILPLRRRRTVAFTSFPLWSFAGADSRESYCFDPPDPVGCHLIGADSDTTRPARRVASIGSCRSVPVMRLPEGPCGTRRAVARLDVVLAPLDLR